MNIESTHERQNRHGKDDFHVVPDHLCSGRAKQVGRGGTRPYQMMERIPALRGIRVAPNSNLIPSMKTKLALLLTLLLTHTLTALRAQGVVIPDPGLNAAIREQLERVAHVTSLGSSNPTTIKLAKRLVEIGPPGLEHVLR